MRNFVILLLTGFVCSASAEGLVSVDVFYTKLQSVRTLEQVLGVKPNYHNLDIPKILEEKINLNMPSNLKAATSYMSRYANSKEGKNTINLIVDGYQGVGEAFRLGVKELPAVVINKKYVVYGTVDINLAVNRAVKKGVLNER